MYYHITTVHKLIAQFILIQSFICYILSLCQVFVQFCFIQLLQSGKYD